VSEKMNLPNIKDVLQKLAVFKNNVSLLVAVILAAVGGLLFVPTYLMSRGLQAQVQQESISSGAKLIEVLTQTVVPEKQYVKAAALKDAHAKDANDVELMARQTTQRELLSYDIFPAPDPNAGFSALIFQLFGQRYRKGIDELITRVNAGDCPTNEEIKRGLDDLSSSPRSRSGYAMMDGYESMPMGGLYGGMTPMGGMQRVIVDEMCLGRAKSISVYVNSADIAGYEYWGSYTYGVKPEDAVKDCWYHQLGYWVIHDVFDTIEAMNSGHDNVLTAPVKRFMRITFTMGINRPRAGGGGTFTGFSRRRRQTPGQGQTLEADKPAYVLAATDGLTESCTGRLSKPEGDIDVIHFSATFVVSARDVLPFMDKLCSGKEHPFRGYPDGNEPPQTFKHNQISILESKIGSPGLGSDPAHRYYSYGSDNVVELDLICEYVLNRKGYEIIMPELVKTTIAGKDQQTTQ